MLVSSVWRFSACVVFNRRPIPVRFRGVPAFIIGIISSRKSESDPMYGPFRRDAKRDDSAGRGSRVKATPEKIVAPSWRLITKSSKGISRQLVKQRLCIFEDRRVEAFDASI